MKCWTIKTEDGQTGFIDAVQRKVMKITDETRAIKTTAETVKFKWGGIRWINCKKLIPHKDKNGCLLYWKYGKSQVVKDFIATNKPTKRKKRRQNGKNN